MENQVQTVEEAIEAVTCGCVGCISVPVSTLQFEADVPIGGWDGLFEQLGIKQVTDHIGRRAVTAVDARRLLNSVRRQDERFAEDHARRSAELAVEYPVPSTVGVPAVEGMSPFESLVAAGGVVSPQDEFGGIPRPDFLRQEIEAGARAIAEDKREAEVKAKQRLAKQMQDRLGGKR